MPEFALLFYDGPESVETFQSMSPAEMQTAIQRYIDWSTRLAEQGKLAMGHKLEDGTGRVMRPGGAVTDGPYSEAREVIGGLMIIEAASYQEAVELCRDHPHLDHGPLELRAIDPMGSGVVEEDVPLHA